MAGVIDKASEAIKARLEELREEQSQLQRAFEHLSDTGSPRRDGRKRGRGGRRKGSGQGRGQSITAKPKASRAKGSTTRAPRGQRRDQFVAAVKETPGQTASEIARSIGISANQVQAVARKARAEKLVRKRGRKYFPAN